MRRSIRSEDGFTITELAITAALLLVVVGSFLTVLESVHRGIARQEDRSNANDQARLAVEQLDREIRSGNILYDPDEEVPANYSVRVYTQANATTRTPAFQCVQWRIEDGNLVRRSWPPGDSASVSAWRVIATDVVNVEEGVPAFTLDPDPLKAGRTVRVVLLVNSTPGDPTNRNVRIETSLTGRNTSFGFPNAACDPVPGG